MMSISLFISILSVINFSILYHFIIEKRKKSLSIMRLCGYAKLRTSLIYLSECIILTLSSCRVHNDARCNFYEWKK
ncbi:MAG: FtsX-like permease family protein [Oscillospiraceae bacterium]